MAPPWVALLSLIQNGEPVDASVANRVSLQLGQRTEYLKAIVDILGAAKGTFDLDAAVAPDVQEGFAVYWNGTNLRYENALAVLDTLNSAVYSNVADSAYCVGICVGKASPVRGTVMFGGVAETVDFSTAIGGTLQAGPYFLSSVEPGHMVRQRPPVGIVVMFGMQNLGPTSGTAFVMPTPREILEDHIHYRLPLEYGTTLGDPGWSNILDPNIAPAGARYRYTEESDPEISQLFPFYPPDNVYFEIDGIGANEKVIIDLNGIWWVDPDYEPDEYNNMVIWYAKPTAKTNDTMVSSLRSLSSVLQILDCNGRPAYAGDLYAKLDLLLRQGGDAQEGWLAFKELNDEQQFIRGPVVESIRSVSPEIQVAFEVLDAVNQGQTGTRDRKYGNLLLSYINPSSLANEGRPNLTSLTNATQEDYNGQIPYLGLPAGLESSVAYRFDIPTSGLSGTYKFFFKVWIFATVTGVLPTLQCSYVLVKAAKDTELKNMSGNVPGSDPLSIPIVNVNANDYVLAALLPNTGIDVEPGDQIHVSIERNDNSYGGAVGILQAFFVMTKAS